MNVYGIKTNLLRENMPYNIELEILPWMANSFLILAFEIL